MTAGDERELVRIHINESDAWEGQSLYKAIVEKVRSAGFAGCTVFGGVEGFGRSHTVHDARFEGAFLDLPVIIEIVDRLERIETLWPMLDPMITEGLVTREKIHVA